MELSGGEEEQYFLSYIYIFIPVPAASLPSIISTTGDRILREDGRASAQVTVVSE